MSTTKLIHIADIHFRGYKRHREYRQIMEEFFEKARQIEPDGFVIAGDIVHSKTQNITPELIEILSWWFTKMAEIAPVHVTLGNHDGLLTNLSRQDTISPIISALDDPNILLYKDSGVFPIADGKVDLCVFSPFDEDGWAELIKYKTPEDRVSVAVFHGSVRGCTTDDDWALDSDVDVSLFDPFDFTFLGDIHKRQDMDEEGRVAYPGSMIQQNFGETREKGFLTWHITSAQDFRKDFHALEPVNPYVTLEWLGDIESTVASVDNELLQGARVRIKSDHPLSQVETREASKFLRQACDAHDVYFKQMPRKHLDAVELTEDTATQVKRDPASLLKMLVELQYVDKDDTDTQNELLELIKAAKDSVVGQEMTNAGTWTVDKMEFDNTFGYGPDNSIDFGSLNGLVGVFGQNRIGKSSIPATLLYALFNTSDRGLNKNVDIVNVRKDYCSAKVDFLNGGDKFRVERQTTKRTNRKGEVSAATHLNFATVDEHGDTVEDMNGEQRRDTDKELRAVVGTADDFVLTAFSTQGDMSNFISAGPTQRKELLARFLQLDFFNDLYAHFRDSSSGIRRRMSDAQTKLAKVNAFELASSLKEMKTQRDSVRKQIDDIEKQLDELRQTDGTEGIDRSRDRQKWNRLVLELQEAESDLAMMEESKSGAVLKVARLEKENLLCQQAIESIDAEELEQLQAAHTDLLSSHALLEKDLENKQSVYSELKRSVEILKKVPCGDQFPKCRFIKDSHSNRGKIESQKQAIKDVKASMRAASKAMKAIDIDRVEAESVNLKKLMSRSFEIEKSILKATSDLDDLQSSITDKKERTTKLLQATELLQSKWGFGNDEDDSTVETSPAIKLTNLLSEQRQKEQKLSEKIGSQTQMIRQAKDLADEVTSIKKEHALYEVLMQAFNKNGIPAKLVTTNLPIINQKLGEALFEDCGFTIELESDESSKKLEIFIDYGDSKRKIECASGMERMIASLALRTALHSITHLPKPDFMIVDEGFGALDDSNVEVCMSMMRSMLNHFRFILIISHVDSVKDSVDAIIEVNRRGLDSHVVYE
jgi:DNA repair exonuclease SbcCD ATPase subunit/DNA repair exonuclease SbcCD nuclease subunit